MSIKVQMGMLEQLTRIADALEKLTDISEPVVVVRPQDKKVDVDGPVDRAGRPMRYTDGTDIPVEKRQ